MNSPFGEKRKNMVRKSLNVGLVMNFSIMHLSFLKERKTIKEITNLEEIESVCVQMKKMILMNKH